MIQKKKFTWAAMLFIMISLGFHGAMASGPGGSGEPNVPQVTIDLSKTYQTIDNFAASDAWSCQFAGHWPDAKKNEMADLLFSTEFSENGQPKGIGLSQWRFNIGAGSAGTQTIKDEWRASESFLQADGSYDWEKQSGQRWFLQAAKERGVEQFLAFANSPPVLMTNNGKAYATSGRSNLSASNFDAYANYLTAVLKGLSKNMGIDFQYISPVNEPQWEWSDGGQEGTPFNNVEISGIVKALDHALQREQLSTKIVVPEGAQLQFLYSDEGKPGQGKQVDAFFKPESEAFIGNLTSVAPLISGHSYFTSSPFKKAQSIRQRVAHKVNEVQGLRFWQSEYCILGDNAGEIKGHHRDLGINPALYVARTIHQDLVFANASAWQWWLAISPYNYKDGLIYMDHHKEDGEIQESKILWALGNYSRFIRPGAVRVAVSTVKGWEESLLISSYKRGNQLVSVIVNLNEQPMPLDFSVINGKLSNESQSYVTSATADLKPNGIKNIQKNIHLEARSITTLISEII